jgi:hypothetical protein
MPKKLVKIDLPCFRDKNKIKSCFLKENNGLSFTKLHKILLQTKENVDNQVLNPT